MVRFYTLGPKHGISLNIWFMVIYQVMGFFMVGTRMHYTLYLHIYIYLYIHIYIYIYTCKSLWMHAHQVLNPSFDNDTNGFDQKSI